MLANKWHRAGTLDGKSLQITEERMFPVRAIEATESVRLCLLLRRRFRSLFARASLNDGAGDSDQERNGKKAVDVHRETAGASIKTNGKIFR